MTAACELLRLPCGGFRRPHGVHVAAADDLTFVFHQERPHTPVQVCVVPLPLLELRTPGAMSPSFVTRCTREPAHLQPALKRGHGCAVARDLLGIHLSAHYLCVFCGSHPMSV